MKTVEEIIVEKEFNELSQEELTLVAELAENEQEYKAMRSLFAQLESEVIPDSRIMASAATKQSLDSIFMAKHPVIAQDWKREEEPGTDEKIVALYNRTWFRAAAVLLLFSGASYYYYENSALTNGEKDKAGRQVAMSIPSKVQETTSTPTDETGTQNLQKRETVFTDNTLESRNFDGFAAPSPVVAAKDMSASAPITTYSYSGGTSASWTFSKSDGLDADLYPNGESTIAEAASVADVSDEAAVNSSSDVSTAEMLDWIQTVY